MKNFTKSNENNQILNRLVLDNCLSFGRSPKLNNRKITHYISGTRRKVDIFNLYEMRYLLLKVYPLIHNLFLQQRLNVKKRKKKIFLKKNFGLRVVSQNLPKRLHKWENFRDLKNKFNKSLKGSVRPLLPKILFATTTEIYSTIVSSAAAKCHMPFHVNRWLSGTITAAASYLDDFERWSFLTSDFEKNINNSIQEKFFKRKKKILQQESRIRKYQLGRKPSLIIIPDVSNNEMIIKETIAFGIPVLGLVSSNSNTEIAYPIFANDFSIYSVHFFCHFLSSLITKEIVKNKHKLYIATKKKINIQFTQATKEMFDFDDRVRKFKLRKKRGIKKEYYFKGRYFIDNLVKPRINIRKELKNKFKINKVKKKIKYAKPFYIQKKTKKSLISPKKLILIEGQKFAGKKKNLYYLKRQILPRIKLLKKLRHFSFSKIVREIRLPKNKPKFRFWNQNKFFFSNTLPFVKNTSWAFQFKRFVFPKWLKRRFWKRKQKEEEENYKGKFKGNYKKKKYRLPKINITFRKREWPTEKLKKNKLNTAKNAWTKKKN